VAAELARCGRARKHWVAVILMKLALDSEDFRDGVLATIQSRFEQPDVGPFCEPPVCALFSRRLQKLFPPPSESSAPEHVRGLLQRIHEIFAGPYISDAK
jgi:hypothetical protein